MHITIEGPLKLALLDLDLFYGQGQLFAPAVNLFDSVILDLFSLLSAHFPVVQVFYSNSYQDMLVVLIYYMPELGLPLADHLTLH